VEVTIRPVGPEDVESLVPLMRAYCAFYGTAPADGALAAMSRSFLAAGDRATQLIARDPAGDAVGYATILWSWDTTLAAPVAVMEDLFVAAQTRGAGVGRALIEACRRAAAARGVAALDWMTAPDNHTAQALYDATGARRTSWLSYRLPTAADHP
jgi:ribosomal protein S18 acetylase RimI-like enzyme